MIILGCKLDPIDSGQATEAILRYAREGTGAQVITLGTEMVVYAQRDEKYRDVINASALSLCDTVGLLGVARSRGAKLRERVAGVELIEHLCDRAAKENLSIYLLGGAPGIAQRAGDALEARHPGLQIAGARDGYFGDDQSIEVAAAIRASGARILFAGMGFPRQEFWLAGHLRETGCGVGVGVGGSFDVISGNVQRAPERWRKAHLEWLYRLVREPQRWRRQLALPYFVLLIAGENVRNRFARGKT
jgi:N-acetylglucosaminyldiphosphoundecaprenol N-acetyl-beta-D-mannosaminyltransferase